MSNCNCKKCAKRKATYNGHKNVAHWNVALWLSNDEPMYREAMRVIRVYPNLEDATTTMRCSLPSKTPDGYTWSRSAVRAALAIGCAPGMFKPHPDGCMAALETEKFLAAHEHEHQHAAAE